MRHLILLASLLFTTANYAQRIGSVQLADIDTEFIDVTADYLGNSPSKTTIYIDYGQQTKKSFPSKEYILNENNDKPMYFYSEIGIINYFYKFGYTLIKIYKSDTYPKKGFIFSKTPLKGNNTDTQDIFADYKK
ncbi:hypothetical protein HX017_16010 [Myroides marinus]|uniref:hypothetical protein n=1 Tax=Myroides marinus TaxID=703342 RepID=UPI0025762B4A|nr:hypothetical protein [Myroides marinus]MDM1348565.1 hypothetical protein [Myroides marinus]MDM1352104.1 hypothetical protein [Myroides marinus]MDM1355666.1 hypothetical protein [Myroides marinus]MDM1359311.1 hypothetical protein [Myroides marinus]MDM1362955.1 hypothetical protein [Myroides marinus]